MSTFWIETSNNLKYGKISKKITILRLKLRPKKYHKFSKTETS